MIEERLQSVLGYNQTRPGQEAIGYTREEMQKLTIMIGQDD
jgi:hypothetical protein